MFRIPDFILECSIYLYGSVEDAENGRSGGGSGFLIGVSSAIDPSGQFVYAVTNRHVIENGASVVRLNRRDGGIDCLNFKPTDWVTHPCQDIAAVLIPLAEHHRHTGFIPQNMLLSREVMAKMGVGPGDDTFLVGRFVYADGGLKNHPSVRFGRISMNPGEPIEQEGGHRQESFLIESHSIGGYSGSPVFLLLHPYSIRANVTSNEIHEPKVDLGKGHLPIHLLGVDWGHLPAKWIPVVDQAGHIDGSGMGLMQNSGMMGVVPAWYVQELLDIGELSEVRDKLDAVLAKPPERSV